MAACEEGQPEHAILAEEMRVMFRNIIYAPNSHVMRHACVQTEELRSRFNATKNIADKIQILEALKEFDKHLTYCRLNRIEINVRNYPEEEGEDDDTPIRMGGEVTISMSSRGPISYSWVEEAHSLTHNLEVAMHGNPYFSLLILANEGIPESTLFVNLTG
jgi:hypothetical protein